MRAACPPSARPTRPAATPSYRLPGRAGAVVPPQGRRPGAVQAALPGCEVSLKGSSAYSDVQLVSSRSKTADLQTSRRARRANAPARADRQTRLIDEEHLRISSDCAQYLHPTRRQVSLRSLPRILKEVPILIRFLYALPLTKVDLSDAPSGLAIAEHLSLKRWGIPRFRLAQGVLYLPSSFASYLSGRRRQAVRTNIHRARDLGIECHSRTLPAWTRPGEKLTRSAPVEHWWAASRDGATVGEAWLTVDDECALLHSMSCSERYARWLLHTAIVERLCVAHCRVLLTNSFDLPLMAPGQQYFQRLLGYSIARVSLNPSSGALAVRRRVPIALLSVVATALIVGQQTLTSPFNLAGHRAMIWLAALVAVRVAANRAGWATLVGATAAVATALTGAMPAVALAYLLCGFALDVVLALVPGLARNALAMACAGPAVMFVTVVAPAFPSLGHHQAGVPWPIPPVLGAIVFGALATIVGHYVGRRLRNPTRAPLQTA
jgi:hypothetical protein